MRNVEHKNPADRTDDPDRMDDVDRIDTVDRQETLTTEPVPAGPRDAEPLPAGPYPTEPGTAEPLPVDESGLETGKNARPDHTTDVTDDATVHSTDHVTADARDDTTDHVTDDAAVHDADDDTVQSKARDTVHDTEVFTGEAVARLRARWRELQADFVDDPQRAVQDADDVLDEVLRTITEHRERLAGEWQDHTDTEDLRLAMRGYRSFFDRLLPMT